MSGSAWWGFVLVGATLFFVMIALGNSAKGQRDVNEIEVRLAGAYHCGMLDAVQEKRGRGRACDDYKAIAKRRGVAVPP